MPVMDETNRFRCWARAMRERLVPATIGKAAFRAAVNAFDDWIDANQANAIASLPQPYRSASTADQKANLFHAVLSRRRGKYQTEED